MAAATEMDSGLIWWIWSDNDSKPGAIWFVSACRLARLGSSQCAPCEGHGGAPELDMAWYGCKWGNRRIGCKTTAMTTLRNLLLAICFFRHFWQLHFPTLVLFFLGRPESYRFVNLSTTYVGVRGHEWSQKGQRSSEDRSGVVAVGAVKIEMNSPRPNSCFKKIYKLA